MSKNDKSAYLMTQIEDCLDKTPKEEFEFLTDEGHFLNAAYNEIRDCYNEIEELQIELKASKEREAKLRKCMQSAYKYLKSTYDIHTWKHEPEYQMIESFEQCLRN